MPLTACMIPCLHFVRLVRMHRMGDAVSFRQSPALLLLLARKTRYWWTANPFQIKTSASSACALDEGTHSKVQSLYKKTSSFA